MSNKNDFTVKLNLMNIGPHYGENTLSFSDILKSNKSIFYAQNGTGKSFISRAFRLCAPSIKNVFADDLLTLEKPDGHFSFSILSNGVDNKLDITIKRGEAPVIDNSSEYLFHVFNSDYVEENIKAKHYSPDGKIDGYILGKIQIDLSEERRNASALKDEIEEENKVIDNAIERAKVFLNIHGITRNTTEFRAITREQLEVGFKYDMPDSVEECVRKLEILNGVPENLPDIEFPLYDVDISFLGELERIMTTVYPKSEWDETFVKEYKIHQRFIEGGLDCNHSDTICPFCKREYDSESLDLIKQYNEYRKDQEARIVAKLREMQQLVNSLGEILEGEERKINNAESQLVSIQKYFPSLKSLNLGKITSSENYKTTCKSLSELISQKTDCIYLVLGDIGSVAGSCRKVWEEIAEIQKNNQKIVREANKAKNNSSAERLSLRRNLCKAKSLALQDELSDCFKRLKEKEEKLEILQREITRKEQQTRVNKRDKVYETLDSFLNRFFNGKYQIDKDSFQIRFLGNTVGENASKILSDGEKSIVAFCWYLAETHKIVNSEDDYNKLFFIIDDPVSSMDYHYVYAVAQSIRDLKNFFEFSDHERIWIFTHNYEFFNIVVRNNISTNIFLMRPGSIQVFNHKLLMPYENHLIDLTEIANGKKVPNHTTGNSIRHILETIAKFEDPTTDLRTFVRKEEFLSKDSYIFTLCQDLSHGSFRSEPSYDDDMIRNAAKRVIEFIEKRYPGQLKIIKQEDVVKG